MRKAVLMTLSAIISLQFGSSVAKGVFPAVGPLAMVWMRFVVAGLLLTAIVRPSLRHHAAQDWLILVWYTVALTGMNVTFYQATSRIPIGIAVTVQFLGPLVVALLKQRGLRDLAWIGLAAIGVIALGWSPGALDPMGIVFATLAGTCQGAYILSGPHVNRHWKGAEPVALANLSVAIVLSVPVLVTTHDRLGHAWIWGMAVAVGLLSSVIPYVLQLKALGTLEPRVFSILMALQPVFGALFALLMLHERLHPLEIAAMACVIVASVGITWTARDTGTSPDGSGKSSTTPHL